MVIFVGDEPSKLNKDPNVAFIGARSYPTLVSWIKKLEVDIPIAMNSNTTELLMSIKAYANNGAAIVALGNKASSRMDSIGVSYFKLPHPSGRNRKLNNKEFVDLELEKCKNYLKGKGKCVSSVRNGNEKN